MRWREREKNPTNICRSLQTLPTVPIASPPVLQDWFHDRDGVVLQVVVDLHIPDTIILIGRLVHCLLEVSIKSQYLPEKRMLSVFAPDTNLTFMFGELGLQLYLYSSQTG